MHSTVTEKITFDYSQETIRQKRRVIIAAALSIPFAMIAFAFFIPKITFDIALVTILMSELLIFFQSRRLLKQFRDMKLLLSNEIIERQSGKFLEQYNLKDITRLVISQDSKKRTLLIKLKLVKKEVILAGFEEMNRISDFLVKRLPQEMVDIKETKMLPINSSFLVPIGAIGTTIVIISIIRANEYTFDLFSSAFQMLLGLYFLIFAPISKVSGVRHRKFEIIGGSLLALISAALLIGEWFGV